jgi:hypothetical protein
MSTLVTDLVTQKTAPELTISNVQHYHADSRDRSRDSGNGSRTNDFQCFSPIMPTLVTDLVTPEMAPELMICDVSALSCRLS